MSDPNGATLKPVAQFVAYESVVRFPVVDVPTELLDWLPPRERVGKPEQGNERGNEDSGDREERMIQSIWSQYADLLEQEGYRALDHLLEKLQNRRKSERKRGRIHKHRGHDLKPLLKFFREYDDRSEETPIREIIDSTSNFDRELPNYHTVTWTGPGGRPDGQNANRENYQGEISPMVESYDVPEFESPSVAFSPSTTLGEITHETEKKLGRCESGLRSTRKLRKLLRFRLRLLQRFLWTYEVAGSVPDDPTVQSVPEVVQRRPTRLAHVIRVMDLIELIHEDGKPQGGEWPSQPGLTDKAAEYFDVDNFDAKPESVVKQAASLVSKVYYIQYDGFRDDFYDLLLQNEEEIREWADELDVEV